jgi:hypothetical protein
VLSFLEGRIQLQILKQEWNFAKRLLLVSFEIKRKIRKWQPELKQLENNKLFVG